MFSKIPQERLFYRALHGKIHGKRSVERPRFTWSNYIDELGGRWEFQSSEMMEVMEEVKCGGLISSCCPPTLMEKRATKQCCSVFYVIFFLVFLQILEIRIFLRQIDFQTRFHTACTKYFFSYLFLNLVRITFKVMIFRAQVTRKSVSFDRNASFNSCFAINFKLSHEFLQRSSMA